MHDSLSLHTKIVCTALIKWFVVNIDSLKIWRSNLKMLVNHILSFSFDTNSLCMTIWLLAAKILDLSIRKADSYGSKLCKHFSQESINRGCTNFRITIYTCILGWTKCSTKKNITKKVLKLFHQSLFLTQPIFLCKD